MSITACFSGPERTRAHAEVAIEDAGLALLPSDHHAVMDWGSKLAPYPSGEKPPKGVKAEPQGFVTILALDADGLNAAVAVVDPAGWMLRVHYLTPPKPEPSPEMKIAATLEEMRAKIAALEARQS